jgi:hypothetical protein
MSTRRRIGLDSALPVPPRSDSTRPASSATTRARGSRRSYGLPERPTRQPTRERLAGTHGYRAQGVRRGARVTSTAAVARESRGIWARLACRATQRGACAGLAPGPSPPGLSPSVPKPQHLVVFLPLGAQHIVVLALKGIAQGTLGETTFTSSAPTRAAVTPGVSASGEGPTREPGPRCGHGHGEHDHRGRERRRREGGALRRPP